MGDRNAGKCIAEIAGFRYETAADVAAPGQIVSCEITQADDEATQCTLIVFDRVDPASIPPYVEFNRFPNPRIVENIPVIVYGGWPDEGLFKMFEGVLAVKSMDEETPSHTKFVAYDQTRALRKNDR